jgi:CHRD domain
MSTIRTKTILTFLALGLLTSTAAIAGTVMFKADLKGSTEVPPTDSAATGHADVTLDTDAKKLSWKLTYSGLTGDATAAHFHGPAAPGENAPPVIDISKMIENGTADLTDVQLDALQAGKWYVNIHTAKYPNGEIRGQVE